MKQRLILLLMILFGALSTTIAQDRTTVEALSDDIANNLDLELVASLFGEASDLEHFEYLINDPEKGASNLDLNNDGMVDYLRVLEVGEDNSRLIVLQSVIGEDQFQDVATVEVERDAQGVSRVQVVGDVHMYGPNYIIEPIYVVHPPLFVWLWRPNYVWYRSAFHWGHYPVWYNPWRPYPYAVYHDHCITWMHHGHHYHHVGYRRLSRHAHLHSQIRRNDYASNHPNRAFVNRHKGTKNFATLSGKTVRTDRITEAPVKSAAVKQEPVRDSGLKQTPTKSTGVKQTPTKSNTVKQEPVKQAPAVKSTGKAVEQNWTKPSKTVKSTQTESAVKSQPKKVESPSSKPRTTTTPSTQPKKSSTSTQPRRTEQPAKTKEATRAEPSKQMVPRNSNTIRKPAPPSKPSTPSKSKSSSKAQKKASKEAKKAAKSESQRAR